MSKTCSDLRAFSWGIFSWTEMICVKKLTFCNSVLSGFKIHPLTVTFETRPSQPSLSLAPFPNLTRTSTCFFLAALAPLELHLVSGSDHLEFQRTSRHIICGNDIEKSLHLPFPWVKWNCSGFLKAVGHQGNSLTALVVIASSFYLPSTYQHDHQDYQCVCLWPN